jgi:hypothetical protein
VALSENLPGEVTIEYDIKNTVWNFVKKFKGLSLSIRV